MAAHAIADYLHKTILIASYAEIESKYHGEESEEAGDEQFEISDARSFDQMYEDIAEEGLQPVLNDYVYV